MKLSERERELTVALGNEIEKNKMLTNIVNRVLKTSWKWDNSGAFDDELAYKIVKDFTHAIDENLSPHQCRNVFIDYNDTKIDLTPKNPYA